MVRKWNDKVFQVKTHDFEQLALEIFWFQYEYNNLYKGYVDAIGVSPRNVRHLKQLPFLPIRFFQSHSVQVGSFDPAVIFESSGTTGSVPSHHYLRDITLYETSFTQCFERFYGSPEGYCILGLLPSYLERQNSSLVYMVDRLIKLSGHPDSGFYLHDLTSLTQLISGVGVSSQRILLFGVSFALLDLAEKNRGMDPQERDFSHVTIIETGGMKGRKKEMIRPELHERLQSAFPGAAIHSEYGMTELLSQAYSVRDGIFASPPWMKFLVRDEEDPFLVTGPGESESTTGAINIIDLANVDSCCFLATDDAGRLYRDGSFEILGRLDGSDLRGCSLLAI